ncbi:MAG TPA: DUF5693 family protein [Thermotogota bacterium]|nr:DUF5693 family protein [Thermotogota bacterium]
MPQAELTVMERLRRIAFVFFLFSSVLTIFLYVYPRIEFDANASDVAFGFESGYNGNMETFFPVRPLDSPGVSGERVVYICDFSKVPLSRIPGLLSTLDQPRVVFFEQPPPTLSASTLAQWIEAYRIRVGFLELNASTSLVRSALQLLPSSLQQQMFRVHTIKPAEVEKLELNFQMVLRRWMRARNERSIDFFWIQPLPPSLGKDYDSYGLEMIGLFRPGSSIQNPVPQTLLWLPWVLMASGFALIFFYSPLLVLFSAGLFTWGWLTGGPIDGLLYLSGVTAAFGITGFFRDFREFESGLTVKYFSLVAFAFALGIAVNAMGFSFAAMNQIYLPHGVKLTLFYLPFLVFLREFAHYGANNLKSRLHWTDMLVVILVLLGILYYLIRSGNLGFVSTLERRFRDFLEELFGIRPRFKELLGIPALFLYIQKKHVYFGRYSFLLPVLGAIGLCSIVNSFQHVHSPLSTVIWREALGVGIGTLVGWLLSLLFPRQQPEKTLSEHSGHL